MLKKLRKFTKKNRDWINVWEDGNYELYDYIYKRDV